MHTTDGLYFITTADMLSPGDEFMIDHTAPYGEVRTVLRGGIHTDGVGHVDCKLCEGDGREAILGPRIAVEYVDKRGVRVCYLSADTVVYVRVDNFEAKLTALLG